MWPSPTEMSRILSNGSGGRQVSPQISVSIKERAAQRRSLVLCKTKAPDFDQMKSNHSKWSWRWKPTSHKVVETLAAVVLATITVALSPEGGWLTFNLHLENLRFSQVRSRVGATNLSVAKGQDFFMDLLLQLGHCVTNLTISTFFLTSDLFLSNCSPCHLLNSEQLVYSPVT